MSLEIISGNLCDAYQLIVPGTMLHVDELTARRINNPEFQGKWFFPADGNLYTVNKEGKALWGITRQPQNLVLKEDRLNEACAQLAAKKNYIPPTNEARVCFEHLNTVVINLHELKLAENCGEYSYFVIDPRHPNKLNPQQKLAAMRIFGPDKENYGNNLEMFAAMGKTPHVFALTPSYVKTLCQNQNNAPYITRVSWLGNFDYSSSFHASSRFVDSNNNYVCGERKKKDNPSLELTGRDAPKNRSLMFRK